MSVTVFAFERIVGVALHTLPFQNQTVPRLGAVVLVPSAHTWVELSAYTLTKVFAFASNVAALHDVPFQYQTAPTFAVVVPTTHTLFASVPYIPVSVFAVLGVE